MILVNTQHGELMFRSGEGSLRILLVVFRNFHLAFGVSAFVEQKFRSLELHSCKPLIINRLQVCGKGAGDISALHLH